MGPTLAVLVFPFFYFVDTLLRSAQKYFWYDELFTYYLCRLPTLKTILEAQAKGLDFNPPLFYVFTRLAMQLPGPEIVTARLPEIIGFWLLCVCLFRVAFEKVGLSAGIVAMCLPLITGVYFYASEARPHGIVLGCAGLSLLCWTKMQSGIHASAWRVLFVAALLCAFLNHCYAPVLVVPYLLSEIAMSVGGRRVRWGVFVACLLPVLVAGISYVPLLHSYHRLVGGSNFNDLFPPNWNQLDNFYLFLLAPSLAVFISLVILQLAKDYARMPPVPFSSAEIVLAIGFLLIPASGIVVGKIANAPFFARYFSSAVIGIALFLACSLGTSRRWACRSAAICVLALIVSSTYSTVSDYMRDQGRLFV